MTINDNYINSNDENDHSNDYSNKLNFTLMTNVFALKQRTYN